MILINMSSCTLDGLQLHTAYARYGVSAVKDLQDLDLDLHKRIVESNSARTNINGLVLEVVQWMMARTNAIFHMPVDGPQLTARVFFEFGLLRSNGCGQEDMNYKLIPRMIFSTTKRLMDHTIVFDRFVEF